MVSDADREAEAALVELLTRERPEDGILGEEGASREGSSGRTWIVDPLDGTTNYLWGYPTWSVSVGLEDGEGGLVGVVHDPLREETFRAARGRGSQLNGSAIRVREDGDLAASLVATGFGYSGEVRAAQAEVLRRVLPAVRDIRRAGSAALDLAWVAAGRLDGYFERGGNSWDWSAGTTLVLEAGGTVESYPGEPSGLLAARPRLLSEIRTLVT